MKTRLTYSEKLKDPRWQLKRTQVLVRDNFTCRCCGDNDTRYEMHVHHQQYNGEPWDANVDFLITLCPDCHTWVEDKKKTPLSVYQAHIIWTYDKMLDGQMGWTQFNRMRKINSINYIISYAYGEQNQVWR